VAELSGAGELGLSRSLPTVPLPEIVEAHAVAAISAVMSATSFRTTALPLAGVPESEL
jgi:hypothetical protein